MFKLKNPCGHIIWAHTGIHKVGAIPPQTIYNTNYTGMAKILPIHRIITHINILHTQSKALNNELTKPARPTKRPKETLNTHIDTYSIIPTLTYNVKFPHNTPPHQGH